MLSPLLKRNTNTIYISSTLSLLDVLKYLKTQPTTAVKQQTEKELENFGRGIAVVFMC